MTPIRNAPTRPKRTAWTCRDCSRPFASRAGLRIHRWIEHRRKAGLLG